MKAFHVYKYRVTVKHDKGKVQIILAATSKKNAREVVCNAENCPAIAVLSVVRISQIC